MGTEQRNYRGQRGERRPAGKPQAVKRAVPPDGHDPSYDDGQCFHAGNGQPDSGNSGCEQL